VSNYTADYAATARSRARHAPLPTVRRSRIYVSRSARDKSGTPRRRAADCRQAGWLFDRDASRIGTIGWGMAEDRPAQRQALPPRIIVKRKEDHPPVTGALVTVIASICASIAESGRRITHDELLGVTTSTSRLSTGTASRRAIAAMCRLV
jgi:hypothetical protein